MDQHGILDEAKAEYLLSKIRELSDRLAEQDKIVLILADARHLKGYVPGTERIGLVIRETIPFARMAIIVEDNTGEIAQSSETVTAKSSRKKEIGYFTDETAATKWLRPKL